MLVSHYLLKPFYSTCWRLLNLFQPRHETVFYCHSSQDMQNWLPIQKHLKPIRIVSDKLHTIKELRAMGYQVLRWPVFPKAVIMCRVAAHKFPSQKVIKIGLTHGVYHFKRMSKKEYYQPFSLYLFTSGKDLENAQKHGIRCGAVGGYPKLDPYLMQASAPAPDKTTKKRILFTATYDASGMSSIHLWKDRLCELSSKYEILVSLHPWMDKSIKEQIANLPNVRYLKDAPLPEIANVDLCVADTSSIIGECFAFDKPLISWVLPAAKRSVPEIPQILEKASLRISNFDELPAAIERTLQNPDEFAAGRAMANAIFFDSLDGNAGKRSAEKILNLLPELCL